MFIRDLLLKVDYMGKDFKFLIKGDESFKTIFGGLISLFAILANLICFWYFGQDLWYRESPAYLVKKENLDNYSSQLLNNSNFFAAIAIQNANNDPIDDRSYFSHEFTYYQFQRDNITGKMVNKYKETFDLEKCTSKHINLSYISNDISGYYCMTLNHTVGGDFEGENFYYLMRFAVQRCSSRVEKKFGIKCKTDAEVLKQYRDGTKIASFIQKPIIDPTHYEDPIKRNYEYRYENYDIRTIKENRFFYSRSDIEDDSGLVFSDFLTKTFYNFETVTTDYYNVDDPSLNSIKFYFQYTKLLWSHQRIYIKIPDVIAIVGGLMSIFQELINYFFAFYIDNTLAIYLYNQLFDISEEGPGPNEKSPEVNSKGEPIQLKDISSLEISKNDDKVALSSDRNKNGKSKEEPKTRKNSGDKLEVVQKKPQLFENQIKQLHNVGNNQKFNSDIKNYIDYKKIERNKIKIHFCENLAYLYFCRTKTLGKTFKLLQLVEDELGKKSDIIHLLKNIDQLNTVSKTILNKNQYYMLKNKRLKFVSANQKIYDTEDFEELLNQTNREKIEELIKYLSNKNGDSTLNDVDKMLFVSLDQELKELIKKEANIDI